MMLKTDFRESGAGNLVDYIQRDRSQDAVETVDLRNQTGRQLSETDVDRFVEKSREFQFQRHMIVSPDPEGQYTPEEVSANTREVMNREFGQRPTTEYVYAVHRDTEFPHAHVALTGRESELEMDRAEIERLRERASTVYNEPDRARDATQASTDTAAQTPSQTVPDETREELHERELSLEEHPEKDVLQDRARSQETSPSTPSPENKRDKSRAQERQSESVLSREADSTAAEDNERERELEPEAESEREPEPERDMDRTMGG
ncbi:relaxase/mobilization nuclease domain-containing protein [Haloarcula salinisoli]|uniref:Relaxase n=1 Tax=Haloarcula salinisoli TaxID=2487746 RepID=A0A8J8CAX8_9EURY|nr:relaxase/mobilization nuclease domain-containing protein [Halomicroarcula salinisoli]MBX0305654.1 relaxase [Halomicroarcula salinisoli]